MLKVISIDKIAGAWGEHYSESDGYLDLLDGFLYKQLLDNIVFNKETNYNEKIEAMGLFFDIIQNKDLYYNSAAEELEKCISVLENILKTEDFSSWKEPEVKRKSTENFLRDMKNFLKNEDTRSTTLFDKFEEAEEPGCINADIPVSVVSQQKQASSEDLEISRGEIGISLDDNDPTKDKEKSTKNRWRELPNQNTAVIPAITQHSDNYKKDKLDKAKYTNFLGRTDQDTPVEVYDFVVPGRPVSLDDYFNKHTDTLQDDQQHYDTRNFGKGKLQPKQYSNFLYKNEVLHVEDLTKLADLESKKPYLLKDLEKSKYDKKDYDQIIEICNRMDPTGDKAIYTQWILRHHALNEEPMRGDDSLDYLQKFTELKNSKKLKNDEADINHYKSFTDLKSKVDQLLEEAGGFTSKRKEEITKAEEGIKKLDQEGDIELYVVTTPEAAAKEFRNTAWCIKDPKYFEQYAETDPNFYYFKKDGKPFLLTHPEDIKDADNYEPSNDILSKVAPLMAKYNLTGQYDLLNGHIVTKEDGELFDKVLNNILEKGDNSFYLLRNEVITKEDMEVFMRVFNISLEEGYGFRLLKEGIITKEDGDLYNKTLDNVAPEDAIKLFDNGFITRDDSENFNKWVNTCIDQGFGFDLISKQIVTKEDSDLYNRALDQVYTQYNINKTELLHITTLDKISAEQDSSATTSITPSVTDNVSTPVTQKPVNPVTQGKGGGKPVKGPKAGGTGVKPLKALYMTDLSNIHIIADRFEDGVTRTELPESSLRRFRQQDANDKNKKEQDETREKMKGKPNKPLHNVPKKDVYAWGNDDLNGGTVFYSNLSIPQMGDLAEMS